MKLVILAKAMSDLREIEDYIGADNPKAGLNFVERLSKRFDELIHFPGLGR